MQANQQHPHNKNRNKWILFSLIPFFLLVLTLSVLAETDGSSWVLPDRDYRMVIAVDANGTTRVDKIAEFAIDFATQLASVGAVGPPPHPRTGVRNMPLTFRECR